jgi:hypothetical protein
MAQMRHFRRSQGQNGHRKDTMTQAEIRALIGDPPFVVDDDWCDDGKHGDPLVYDGVMMCGWCGKVLPPIRLWLV